MCIEILIMHSKLGTNSSRHSISKKDMSPLMQKTTFWLPYCTARPYLLHFHLLLETSATASGHIFIFFSLPSFLLALIPLLLGLTHTFYSQPSWQHLRNQHSKKGMLYFFFFAIFFIFFVFLVPEVLSLTT